MGYNTRFSLNIIQATEEDEFLDRLGADTDEAPVNHQENIEERYETWFDDEIKWYDHEENMREYSAEHPDVLFELSGEGEESGDIWRQYFKNGLCHSVRARITFDDFDETKLS